MRGGADGNQRRSLLYFLYNTEGNGRPLTARSCVREALGTDKLYKKSVDAGVVLGDRLLHEDGEAVGGGGGG